MKVEDKKIQNFLYIFILLLLFPALFINLGLMPITGDEGIRALVSLEMEYSGKLLIPTINGESYFNKPPLYNWILLGFYKITHSHSEFVIRLPSVISLLGFGLTIFLVFFKRYGKRAAFLSSMIFITIGRILFYDSMKGFIDISFSWIVFISFIVIYYFFRKGKFYSLFLLSYLLCSLAFLLKGLPAVLFQGFALLAMFISGKKFQKLFTLAHISGFVLFLLITGVYYYLLLNQNPDKTYLLTLVNESTKRTFIEYGYLKTIVHLFSFPVEQLYHLIPWSVFLVTFFSKNTWNNLFKDDFLRYLFFVFIFNIPVYWISAESYPRYIFSLYPIIISVFVISYIHFNSGLNKITDVLMGISLLLLIPLSLIFPINYEFKTISYPFLMALAGSIFIIFIYLIYNRFKSYRPEIIIISLLIIRIGFNFIALPERISNSEFQLQKEQAREVGRIVKNKCVYVDGLSICSPETSFYISNETGDILKRNHSNPVPDCYLIIHDINKILPEEEVIYRFETRWMNTPLRLSYIK